MNPCELDGHTVQARFCGCENLTIHVSKHYTVFLGLDASIKQTHKKKTPQTAAQVSRTALPCRRNFTALVEFVLG